MLLFWLRGNWESHSGKVPEKGENLKVSRPNYNTAGKVVGVTSSEGFSGFMFSIEVLCWL